MSYKEVYEELSLLGEGGMGRYTSSGTGGWEC